MKAMRIVPRAIIGAIAALTIATGSVVVTAGSASAAVAKLSQSQASSQLSAAGIPVTSSGGCTTRSNSTCTSLSQVNAATIQGAVTLKNASGCALTVTGGTEVGHADGTYSHYNGYKLDFAMTSCLTNYITGNFTSIGGGKWKAGSGNVYYNESNHWDVTFYSCGC